VFSSEENWFSNESVANDQSLNKIRH